MRWPLVSLALVFLAAAPAAQAAGVDATPAGLTFTQDVTDGPSTPQTSLVTNHTGAAVFISSVTGPSSGDFELVADQLGDCSLRVGLFDGESCTVRVRFDPSAAGTTTDSVVVSTSGGDARVSLSGTGTFRSLSPAPTSIAFGSRSIGAGPT